MKKIKIDGLSFELFISSQDILDRVSLLSKNLIIKYKDSWPLCLIVLNGAAVFAVPLVIVIMVYPSPFAFPLLLEFQYVAPKPAAA